MQQRELTQRAETRSKEVLVRPDMVKHHLDRGTKWATVGEVLGSKGVVACPDDRESEAIVGAFAGDFGLIHQAATAVQKQLERSLTEDELGAVFDRYIEQYGQLYMHNAAHGILPLARLLQEDASFQPYVKAEDDKRLLAQFSNLVNNPFAVFQGPREQVASLLQGRLLPLLISPEYIDCGHIKNMLNNEKEYDAPKELTQGLMRVYFKRMWDGAAVDWRVIEHEHHNAQGVIQVETLGDLDDLQQPIPQVRPRIEGGQFFIKHTNLIDRLRERIFDEVISGFDFGQPLDRDEYLREVDELTLKRRNATLKRLAKDKPVITASINGEDWHLRYDGHVRVIDDDAQLVKEQDYAEAYAAYGGQHTELRRLVMPD